MAVNDQPGLIVVGGADLFGGLGDAHHGFPLERPRRGRIRGITGEDVARAQKAARQQRVGRVEQRRVVRRKAQRYPRRRIDRIHLFPGAPAVGRYKRRGVVLTHAAPIAEAAMDHDDVGIFRIEGDAGLAAVIEVSAIDINHRHQIEVRPA